MTVSMLGQGSVSLSSHYLQWGEDGDFLKHGNDDKKSCVLNPGRPVRSVLTDIKFITLGTCYRQSLTYATATFRKVRHTSNFLHVGTQSTYWSTMYVHTRQSIWNPDSNILQPSWPQLDRPATCATAKQYSSATSVLLALSFPHEKQPTRVPKMLFPPAVSLKLRISRSLSALAFYFVALFREKQQGHPYAKLHVRHCESLISVRSLITPPCVR
jgi:hypothetical protein